METISIHSFFHLVFLSFLALFPPVNPIGSSLVVGPFFMGHSAEIRRKAALSIAVFCLALCFVVSIFGVYFFRLFGISTAVVQLAGGFIIARMALQILSKSEEEDPEKNIASSQKPQTSLMSHLFYPLAFPTTMGGGTISVLLALSANSYHPDTQVHLFKVVAVLTASVLMCATVFVCYYSAPTILAKLSPQAAQVCNKLVGFLTFCVGLQIVVNGVISLIEIYPSLKP
ncbi:MarC family protein [Bdellovibrio bacteriovorus]|uniref:UPF0056 membrane protein n=1 Tax=Bdellovibrio bacteriovorus TaxID=959 RepID=A0A1Z3N9J2_BDEBC|nr:MarC family protein [Bdellovibrio bacteriovorus]ASD64153.1 hypothetical protein B9G79_11545 [Bdellovibrio bacteriovorus]